MSLGGHSHPEIHFLNNIHLNAAFLYTECISAFLSKEKYYIKNIGEKKGLFLSLVKYRLKDKKLINTGTEKQSQGNYFLSSYQQVQQGHINILTQCKRNTRVVTKC